MKTILDIIKLSTDYLEKHGIQHAKRQAHELISDALDVTPLELYLQFDRPLNENELDCCRSSLQRRGKGEPGQYIRGFVEFYDCKIHVDPSVLIPRHETEILVDIISKDLAGSELEGKILLDLCCGSGCIGIALKKKFPMLQVVLSDVSTNALEVAKKNATLNGTPVRFLEGDLFAPFRGEKAHYVVCNPPYVAEEELENLEREVRDFEPRMALDGGKGGLLFFRRLAADLQGHLYPKGKAWLEIGSGQGESVKSLFEGAGWKKASAASDWSGHDRFFFLEIE